VITLRQRVPTCARWCVISVLLALAMQANGKSRAECEQLYKPQTGQPGKDVVWVPTSDGLVTRMLQMAAVTDKDYVYDLGAGDGKIAIAAAKQFGAKAVGVEYNPDMAKLAQCLVEAEGVAGKVRIIHGDIFQTDFSGATVLTLYLLPELNLRLRPTILKMQPGTRVVSHSFLMEDWQPDQRSLTDDGQAYLWIVPAKVDGAWTFRRSDGKGSFVVRLEQVFQQISGTAGARGDQPLTDAHLNGSRIDLKFSEGGADTNVAGRVDGDHIEAKVTRDGSTSSYIGTRT
jgi:SAM-dependent methyltransferase